MTKASERQQYQADLLDWRRKHFDELENNMQALIKVRDKEGTGDKEIIEASKAIARHLSGLQADRVAPSKFSGGASDTGQEKTFTLPEEEKKALDEFLAQLHGPTN